MCSLDGGLEQTEQKLGNLNKVQTYVSKNILMQDTIHYLESLFGRLKKEDHKFKASPSDLARVCLKNIKRAVDVTRW